MIISGLTLTSFFSLVTRNYLDRVGRVGLRTRCGSTVERPVGWK